MKSIARLCAAWGLHYGRLLRPPHATTEKRILARDVFVCQLSRALKAGHTVIAADESYCNERENREFSFHPAGSPFASFARPKGAGLGGRVCFVQAIGVNGFAGVPPDLVSGGGRR